MVNGCQECTRLWREYAEATNEHFRLDNKLQLAGLTHDHQAIQQLTPGVPDSRHRQIGVRGQITAHDKQAHDGATG